jgi:hypothetical protein
VGAKKFVSTSWSCNMMSAYTLLKTMGWPMMTTPCEGDIQPAGIIEEANSLMLVASDTAENNVVLLSSLEGINTCDFDFFVQLFLHCAVELHIIDNV